MDLPENVVHRVTDGARDCAVDRRSSRLVLERTRIGRHTPRGNGAPAQRPKEILIPLLANLRQLDVGKNTDNTLVRIVHAHVDGGAVFRSLTVFLVPDIKRCFLEGNLIEALGFYFHDGIHESAALLSVRPYNGSLMIWRQHLVPWHIVERGCLGALTCLPDPLRFLILGCIAHTLDLV